MKSSVCSARGYEADARRLRGGGLVRLSLGQWKHGLVVKRLALWTLNPAIAVQIRARPFSAAEGASRQTLVLGSSDTQQRAWSSS